MARGDTPAPHTEICYGPSFETRHGPRFGKPEEVLDHFERRYLDDVYMHANHVILLVGLSERACLRSVVDSELLPKSVMGVRAQEMSIAMLEKLRGAAPEKTSIDHTRNAYAHVFDFFQSKSPSSPTEFKRDLELAIRHKEDQSDSASQTLFLRKFGKFLRQKSEKHFLTAVIRHMFKPERGHLQEYDQDLIHAFWHRPEYWYWSSRAEQHVHSEDGENTNKDALMGIAALMKTLERRRTPRNPRL